MQAHNHQNDGYKPLDTNLKSKIISFKVLKPNSEIHNIKKDGADSESSILIKK